MKKYRWYKLLFFLIGFWFCGLRVQASSIYDSPYVSFSPDGQAWTTDAGNRNTEWYADDGSDDVVTGVHRGLRDLRTGEHYYAVERSGLIPVAKWTVCLSKVNCCHNSYPLQYGYHGINYTCVPCFRPHFSAWYPICADCGNVIVKCNFYMSRQAAKSIGYLETGSRSCYYYLCPFNGNLEQGTELFCHTCKAVSANRYRIVYDVNAGKDVCGGYMPPSFHMYDNAVRYEGREVTPQTRLHANTYTRTGWIFEGWNTEADGSGTYFADEAEIRNLCEADYNMDQAAATVVLYAIWRPAESVLEIDFGEGCYDGKAGITSVSGRYGEKYEIDLKKLQPPLGYRVVFDTLEGEPEEEIQGTQHFAAWGRNSPFLGKMQEDCYYFYAPDGNTDSIFAVYEPDHITLPEPRRENYSFGGWFYDTQYTRPVGTAGEQFLPTQDITLYAQWVELLLTATDNYEENGGRGAVNLSWVQPDGRGKTYKLYQSEDGRQWKQIYSANDIKSDSNFQAEYGPDSSDPDFRIPYTGFYLVEAHGAQGSDFAKHKGGLGGVVAGKFWLRQGERLSIGVGAQSGENGGGNGELYGNGGGHSCVESNRQGLLLIAGGGGGAGLFDDGGCGGLEEGLVRQGREGESGEAGGGGGYYGGRSGEAVAHYHVDGVCNHVHTGNAALGTGCYTVPVQCDLPLEHVLIRTETWYWGGSTTDYCPNCGSDTCSGHETEYYDHICPVHGIQVSSIWGDTPVACTEPVGYAAGCGRTEQYICGYGENGGCVSSSPAYGGSNYMNKTAGTLERYGAGERKGDGIVRLESVDTGYMEGNGLDGVCAEDKAAPGVINADEVKMLPMGEDNVLVQWRQPQDNGTVYYHRVESYLWESNTKLSVSNITGNTLVSGIKGYWYCEDAFEETCVSKENGCFTEQTEVLIKPGNTKQYLHLAVEDKAGNISETLHIPIGEANRRHVVTWPIYTEQLSVQEGESVYPAKADNTYYVRCDGRTPLVLEYGEYIEGPSSDNYQPGYAIIESDGKSGGRIRDTVFVPACDVGEAYWELPAAELLFTSDGQGYWSSGSYTMAIRSRQCKRLSVTRELLPEQDMHGQKTMLIPIGGVVYGNEVIYSDYQKDIQNGIWLIGDGEAPEIVGLEPLEELRVLDRRKEALILQVTAGDDLSGVRELQMEIENLDNGCVIVLSPDEEGVIMVDITEDIPAFSGDFTVTVRAVDNVGNERVLSYGTTEFGLRAEITHILAPHGSPFKRGEGAVLKIASWGYADRVEVEFPEEFHEESCVENPVYIYEQSPMYKQEEAYSFMIPLYLPERESYCVTVRAYKGDKMLERFPEITVLDVNGTILDELRTRLR